MKKLFRKPMAFINLPFKTKVDLGLLLFLFLITNFITKHVHLKYYYKLIANNPQYINGDLQPLYSNLSLIQNVKKNLKRNCSCLVESIVTKVFIKIKENIDLPVFIGVQKSADGLIAHAWNFDIASNGFIKIDIRHEG